MGCVMGSGGAGPTPRGSSFGLGFGSISQDSLYPSHLPILQHHFDAMWMRGALGQNARDNTGRQCSSALILLLDNLHPQTGVDFTTLGWWHKFILSLSYHRRRRSSANCVDSRPVKSEGHASSWPRCRTRQLLCQYVQFPLKRPLIRNPAKTGANWIVPHVIPFTGVLLASSQLRIPTGLLPDRLFLVSGPSPRCNRFPELDPAGQGRAIQTAGGTEKVDVIGHDDISSHEPIIGMNPNVP